MHEVAKRPHPADRAVDHHWVVAKGKIIHAGVTQARAIVRHQAAEAGGVWPALSLRRSVGVCLGA